MNEWLNEVSDYVAERVTMDSAENSPNSWGERALLRGIFAELRMSRLLLEDVVTAIQNERAD